MVLSCICLVSIEIVVGVEHLVGVEQHDGVEHLVVVEQHDGVERRGGVAWKCCWCSALLSKQLDQSRGALA